jgi:hypothetical protein
MITNKQALPIVTRVSAHSLVQSNLNSQVGSSNGRYVFTRTTRAYSGHLSTGYQSAAIFVAYTQSIFKSAGTFRQLLQCQSLA